MSKALMAKHASIKSRKYGTFPPVIKNKDEYISLGLSLDSIVEIKKYEYKMHNIKINYYPDRCFGAYKRELFSIFLE